MVAQKLGHRPYLFRLGGVGLDGPLAGYESSMTTFFRHPVDNPVITGRFGDWYEGVPGRPRYQHRGVDYGCTMVPVYAPCPLDIIQTYNPDGSFGRAVTGRISFNGWYTLFGHLHQMLVFPGEHVETGQQIGISGNTGLTTGYHLHWQYSPDSHFPTNIAQNLDPLMELNEDMMSPEERQRLERLEMLFGGSAVIQSMIMMGINLKLQIDQQNTAIFDRINQHRMDGHGMPVFP